MNDVLTILGRTAAGLAFAVVVCALPPPAPLFVIVYAVCLKLQAHA
jgi:hypothetical protein